MEAIATPQGVPQKIEYHEEDFDKFDLGTIKGRAEAVRLILKKQGYEEKSDKQWITHLMEGYAMLQNADLSPIEIRKMTDDELEYFHSGTYKASTLAPALTDYVSLLHPMYSSMNPTLATDSDYRISIGAWFFDPSIRGVERGTMIIHEVMHGILGHYDMDHLQPELVNYAGDAIINQQIERSQDQSLPSNFDNSDIFFFPRTIKTKKYPNGMDNNESFMKYYTALEEDRQQAGQNGQNSGQQGKNGKQVQQGQGSGQNRQNDDGSGQSQSGQQSSQNGNGGGSQNNQQSNQSGAGSDGPISEMIHKDGSVSPMNGNSRPCHEMTPEEQNAMDANKVEKAGQLEKEMARAGAQTKAMEQIRKNRSKTGSSFNEFILDALQPPKVKWESILGNVISKSFNTIITGRTDFSYRRPNRRNHPNGFILPGSIAYSPKGVIGCDTSGSMSESDYREALSEVEGLCKSMHGDKLSFITVDTTVTNIQPVKNAKDLKLNGGGGTCMAVFYQYVNNLKKDDKPDFTVLMTDAYIDWEESVEEMDIRMHNIILVTNEGGMEYANKYESKVPNLTVIPIF
jgi:predicted metal-dependent peptidase